jgi:hypothetical protein
MCLLAQERLELLQAGGAGGFACQEQEREFIEADAVLLDNVPD